MFDKNFFFTPLFCSCFWIRDPGWVKSGSGINIPDPQHWLLQRFLICDKKNQCCETILLNHELFRIQIKLFNYHFRSRSEHVRFKIVPITIN
jgi:hypothetical protein